MARLDISLLLLCVCSRVYGLGNVTMDCPSNQVRVENVPTLEMMTCGKYVQTQATDVTTPTTFPRVIIALADLPFACRCPRHLPYIAEDGYTCVTAAQCPPRSRRMCPANQDQHTTAIGQHENTCYAPGEFYGDIAEIAECGCNAGTISMDGQTCVPYGSCPPVCHGDQVLNLVDGRDCTRTCADPAPACGSQPVSRCECPPDKPLLALDGLTCITENRCRRQPVYVPPTPEPLTYPNGTLVQLDCPATQYPVWLSTSDWMVGDEAIETCRDTCRGTFWFWYDGCFGAQVIGCGCLDGLVMNEARQCVRVEECPQDCYGSNQEWTIQGSTCIKTCANPNPGCDASVSIPRCQCPIDRPYLLDHTTCVSLDRCPQVPVCPGDMLYSECGGCPQFCANPDQIIPCLAVCVPGCYCPHDRPYIMANSHCARRADCPPSSCTDLTMNYMSVHQFSIRVTKADNRRRAIPARALQGHPDSPLKLTLRRTTQAWLEIAPLAGTTMTLRRFCVGTTFVKVFDAAFIDAGGISLWSQTVRPRDGQCFGAETQGVSTIRLKFKKKTGKARVVIRDMSMDACVNL